LNKPQFILIFRTKRAIYQLMLCQELHLSVYEPTAVGSVVVNYNSLTEL